MIITRLVGGLGNQMFEYASGYAIARENNTKLYYDKSWFVEKNSTVWTMGYALECFNITAKPIDPTEYRVKNQLSVLDKVKKYSVVEFKEEGLKFTTKPFELGDRLVLDGYWQSEKYFIKYRDEILKEFSFKDKPSEKNKKAHNQIVSTTSVSLHVRRGDYASHKQTNETHGLTSLEYYEKAIDYIVSKVGEVEIFVFSDEPDWCKKNIKTPYPMTFISGNIGHEDMQLMSSCKHHIVANSSFSWWGAWLNPSEEKIVVAPKKWFNDKKLDSSDLIPESWVKL